MKECRINRRPGLPTEMEMVLPPTATDMQLPHTQVKPGLVGLLVLLVQRVHRVMLEPEVNLAKAEVVGLQGLEDHRDLQDNPANTETKEDQAKWDPKVQLGYRVLRDNRDSQEYQETKGGGAFLGLVELREIREEMEKGVRMVELVNQGCQELRVHEARRVIEVQMERKENRVNEVPMVNLEILVLQGP